MMGVGDPVRSRRSLHDRRDSRVEGVGEPRVQVMLDLVVQAAGVEPQQAVALGEVNRRLDLVDLPRVRLAAAGGRIDELGFDHAVR